MELKKENIFNHHIEKIESIFNNHIKNIMLVNELINKYKIEKYISKNILDYVFDYEIMTEYYILKRIHKKALTKEKFTEWLSGTFYHKCMYNKKINKSEEPFYYGDQRIQKSIEFSQGSTVIDIINLDMLSVWRGITYNKTNVELNEKHKIISIKINCDDIKGEISDEIWKLKHIKKVRLQHIKNKDNFNSLADKLPLGVMFGN